MSGILKITVFGVGALGTLFAGHLQKLAAEVEISVFGNWQAQVKKIKRDGLTLIGLNGDEQNFLLRISSEITELPQSDLALILVKSSQTESSAKKILQNLKPDGLAVSFQNGLGNTEILAKELGKNRAVQGTTSLGAFIKKPGTVFHTGAGKTYLPASENLKIEKLSSLLNRAGLKCKITKNASALVWKKLVVNSAVNPLTALLEVKNEALLENEIWRRFAIKTAEETASVARTLKLSLGTFEAGKELENVCKLTAANRSSMLQDIQRGVKTEIDFIAGAVVREARKIHSDTPLNQFLWKHVSAKENGRPFSEKKLAEFV